MEDRTFSFIKKFWQLCTDVYVKSMQNREDFINYFNYTIFYAQTFEFKDYKNFLDYYFSHCEDKSICHVSGLLGLRFVIICLDKKNMEHIVIGPYLIEKPHDEFVRRSMTAYHFPETLYLELKKYYSHIPVRDLMHITTTCNSFLQFYFDTRDIPDSFEINASINKDSFNTELLQTENAISIRALEERYALENEMIHAISSANLAEAIECHHKMGLYFKGFKRFKDPVRNAKNNALIGNVLYRKAAEAGGVHPVYIDALSHKWAIRIETATSLEVLCSYPSKILRSYVLLVQNYSYGNVSPTVRKALNYINLNLNAEMSVTDIASSLGISRDYLTRLFKKEMSCSVIDYINRTRIDTSLKLLNTTDLPIQDIAAQIGIHDFSHFCKTFKKYIGKSPSQYRREIGVQGTRNAGL